MNREVMQKICQEVCEAFTDVEFRSFFNDIASDLREHLQTSGTPASLVEGALDLLERHKRIDASFFLRWRQLRQARAARIAELASLAGIELPETSTVEDQRHTVAADGSTALERLSPKELAIRVAGVVYFFFMVHNARNSPNRAMLVSGAFLLGIVLPDALSRGRSVFVATLLAGIGVIVYARFLEIRPSSPAT
jgi:hypothetical protein